MPDDWAVTLDDLEQRTLALARDGITREAVRHRLNWLVADPSRMTDEMIDCRLKIYQQPGMLDTVGTIMSRVVGMLRGEEVSTEMVPGPPGTPMRPGRVDRLHDQAADLLKTFVAVVAQRHAAETAAPAVSARYSAVASGRCSGER